MENMIQQLIDTDKEISNQLFAIQAINAEQVYPNILIVRAILRALSSDQQRGVLARLEADAATDLVPGASHQSAAVAAWKIARDICGAS